MVKYGAQLTIFAGIVLLSYGINRWQATWFPQPATMNPEIKEREKEKYFFPGELKDSATFDHSKNTRVGWPKWDRRGTFT